MRQSSGTATARTADDWGALLFVRAALLEHMAARLGCQRSLQQVIHRPCPSVDLSQVSLALLQVAPEYDEGREATEIPTRKGAKKAEAKGLTPGQAEALKAQPNTPQGRRDALIMCLLLDYGLRVGEVAGLLVTDIDLRSGELRFCRPKVNVEQTHRLTLDTLQAALAYLHHDASALGPLLRPSRKDGRLHDMGMTERAITDNTDPNSPRRHRGHGDCYCLSRVTAQAATGLDVLGS